MPWPIASVPFFIYRSSPELTPLMPKSLQRESPSQISHCTCSVTFQFSNQNVTGTEQTRTNSSLSPLLSLPAETKRKENSGAHWQPSMEIRQKFCAITGTWWWSGSGDLCRTKLPWLIIQNYFPVGALSISCV